MVKSRDTTTNTISPKNDHDPSDNEQHENDHDDVSNKPGDGDKCTKTPKDTPKEGNAGKKDQDVDKGQGKDDGKHICAGDRKDTNGNKEQRGLALTQSALECTADQGDDNQNEDHDGDSDENGDGKDASDHPAVKVKIEDGHNNSTTTNNNNDDSTVEVAADDDEETIVEQDVDNQDEEKQDDDPKEEKGKKKPNQTQESEQTEESKTTDDKETGAVVKVEPKEEDEDNEMGIEEQKMNDNGNKNENDQTKDENSAQQTTPSSSEAAATTTETSGNPESLSKTDGTTTGTTTGEATSSVKQSKTTTDVDEETNDGDGIVQAASKKRKKEADDGDEPIATSKPKRTKKIKSGSATAVVAAAVSATRGGKKAQPKKRAQRARKPKAMPRRPLSAYNIFFREERALLLGTKDNDKDDGDEEGDGDKEKSKSKGGKTKTKLGFEMLAKTIGKKWKALSDEKLQQFKALAEEDMERYKQEMYEYHQNLAKKRKALQDQIDTPSTDKSPPPPEQESANESMHDDLQQKLQRLQQQRQQQIREQEEEAGAAHLLGLSGRTGVSAIEKQGLPGGIGRDQIQLQHQLNAERSDGTDFSHLGFGNPQGPLGELTSPSVSSMLASRLGGGGGLSNTAGLNPAVASLYGLSSLSSNPAGRGFHQQQQQQQDLFASLTGNASDNGFLSSSLQQQLRGGGSGDAFSLPGLGSSQQPGMNLGTPTPADTNQSQLAQLLALRQQQQQQQQQQQLQEQLQQQQLLLQQQQQQQLLFGGSGGGAGGSGLLSGRGSLLGLANRGFGNGTGSNFGTGMDARTLGQNALNDVAGIQGTNSIVEAATAASKAAGLPLPSYLEQLLSIQRQGQSALQRGGAPSPGLGPSQGQSTQDDYQTLLALQQNQNGQAMGGMLGQTQLQDRLRSLVQQQQQQQQQLHQLQQQQQQQQQQQTQSHQGNPHGRGDEL